MPPPAADFAVIFPAAGRSTRFGDPRRKKVYADLDGLAVWQHSIAAFINRPDVVQIILAIAPEDRPRFERHHRPSVVLRNILVIDGGEQRHDTVGMALERLVADVRFVAVHDAARPCVPQTVIDAVFAAARVSGAAVPGLPVTDTLRRFPAGGGLSETIDRHELFAIQTPQAFRRDWIVDAYAQRHKLAGPITDDAQLVEASGHPCQVVPGSPLNLKITTQHDLHLASLYRRDTGPDNEPVALADRPERWGSDPLPRHLDLADD